MAMTGAGPFITIPLLVGAMGGSQAMLGWLLGAVLSLADGLVWAELAALMPASGGGYAWLRAALPGRIGGAASFLFLWQALVTTPVLVASGAVGFSGYAAYFWPSLTPLASHAIAAMLVVLATWLLCRRTVSVGKLNLLLGGTAIVVMLWAIIVGVTAGHLEALRPTPGWWRAGGFFTGLGSATLYATYDYMGYQVICSLGEEVRRPERTLPFTVVASILLVMALYVPLSLSVLAVVPQPDLLHSSGVVSDLISSVQGRVAGGIATALILVVTFASLIALLFGASRVLYAAAKARQFPDLFGRLHPIHHYPRPALLMLGALGAASCLVPLDTLIEASTVMAILLQSLPILAAAVLWRHRETGRVRPYRMWLYPLPVIVALAGWIFVLQGSSMMALGLGFAAMLAGVVLWVCRVGGN
jgi:amino acid transporter